jgi:peptidyl-prolyl cis-trans isomerase C
MPGKKFYIGFVYWLVILPVLLAACGRREATPGVIASPDATGTASPTETVTPTPIPPSPTPLPLAATVNGQGITLAEFQAELARFQAAQAEDGGVTESEAEGRVLDDLINQELLAQAARENGFVLDEATLAERLDQLIEKAGGQQAFSSWMADQGYTEDSFELAFARSLVAAWMRDQVLAKMPDQVEQVHARQILLYNSEQAQEVLQQLEAGTDFATLAVTYNPTTGGELGWFPRGYLTVPELEEVAFSLQPGEYSDIIESDIGFHILQVIERESDRSLDAGARLALKENALQDWLEMRRNQSEIDILLPERSD